MLQLHTNINIAGFEKYLPEIQEMVRIVYDPDAVLTIVDTQFVVEVPEEYAIMLKLKYTQDITIVLAAQLRIKIEEAMRKGQLCLLR